MDEVLFYIGTSKSIFHISNYIQGKSWVSFLEKICLNAYKPFISDTAEAKIWNPLPPYSNPVSNDTVSNDTQRPFEAGGAKTLA